MSFNPEIDDLTKKWLGVGRCGNKYVLPWKDHGHLYLPDLGPRPWSDVSTIRLSWFRRTGRKEAKQWSRKQSFVRREGILRTCLIERREDKGNDA